MEDGAHKLGLSELSIAMYEALIRVGKVSGAPDVTH